MEMGKVGGRIQLSLLNLGGSHSLDYLKALRLSEKEKEGNKLLLCIMNMLKGIASGCVTRLLGGHPKPAAC